MVIGKWGGAFVGHFRRGGRRNLSVSLRCPPSTGGSQVALLQTGDSAEAGTHSEQTRAGFPVKSDFPASIPVI